MKHLIKMIVSDLDGTLLRTDKTISGQTKTILSECKKSGIKLAYATARGASAEHITSAIPFDGKITMGGATAKVDDKVIYKCLIPNLISRPLLVACNKYGLKVTSEIDGMHYTNYDVSGYEWADDSYITVDFNHHSKDAEKIFLVGLTSEDESFVKSQLPDSLYMVMAVADDVDGFGMIMHKDATKSKAIAT
ncbi:MAG: HAD hydrolase family protein, partial [Defluviitaleaceae bacterium]|nr:HAD hydrolase family protein [Defluviitaleaceae bacterium]